MKRMFVPLLGLLGFGASSVSLGVYDDFYVSKERPLTRSALDDIWDGIARAYFDGLIAFASLADKIAFYVHKYTFKDETPEPVRLDLLNGHLPEVPLPKHRVTMQKRDQRPLIQMFRLPRNDFAF